MVFDLFRVLRRVNIRGGVENTRLQTKAKDTKKNPGQGQGEPLSRPTTGMLEVKAKERTKETGAMSILQKRSSKIFSGVLQQKKKVFKTFFRRSPKKKTSAKNILGDLQNLNNSKKNCSSRAEDMAISRT